MARTRHIRDCGTIPERRHDAFLLALLLAVCLNVAFFVVQALIPRLSYLVQMFGPQPEAVEQEEYPFVLVDPALLDETETDQLVEAEANVTTRAAQAEPAPETLPEERTFREEGIDHLLTAPEGNPGEDIAFQRNPGEVLLPELGEDAPEPPPEDLPEEQSEDIPEPMEQLSEPLPEPPPPMPEAPLPELLEDIPPPVEEPAEVAPEEPPEPAEEPPEPAEEEPDVPADMVDLAMLPVSPEGFFESRPERRPETPQRDSPEFRQPWDRMEEPRPEPPQTAPRSSREGRRQPTFKRIGGASSSGGAPPRRNDGSRIRLLDSDSTMRLLAHRYGEYMRKVAEQLQQSLNRVTTLSPLQYTRGNAKIRFGIAADGSLSYFTTEYPADGELINVRLISEQMLREAAPFDPPTETMLADPNFQKMSVTVYLD